MNNSNHPNLRLLIDKIDHLSNPSTVAESLLKEDAILIEGLLANLAKTAGNALKAPITTVTSAAQGAAVITKALRDPTYLDTLTFLLKKYINNTMKEITSQEVKQFLNKIIIVPTTRDLKAFVKVLFQLSIVNFVKVSLVAAQDQITNKLKEFLDNLSKEYLNLDRYVAAFIAQGFGAVPGILSALNLVNVALFDVLNMLNVKMRSIQPTTPPAGGPPPTPPAGSPPPPPPAGGPPPPPPAGGPPPALAESRSSPVVYKFNMSNYTPIV
jgi:hypothetical protein